MLETLFPMGLLWPKKSAFGSWFTLSSSSFKLGKHLQYFPERISGWIFETHSPFSYGEAQIFSKCPLRHRLCCSQVFPQNREPTKPHYCDWVTKRSWIRGNRGKLQLYLGSYVFWQGRELNMKEPGQLQLYLNTQNSKYHFVLIYIWSSS